jgi:hypothetical protein
MGMVRSLPQHRNNGILTYIYAMQVILGHDRADGGRALPRGNRTRSFVPAVQPAAQLPYQPRDYVVLMQP